MHGDKKKEFQERRRRKTVASPRGRSKARSEGFALSSSSSSGSSFQENPKFLPHPQNEATERGQRKSLIDKREIEEKKNKSRESKKRRQKKGCEGDCLSSGVHTPHLGVDANACASGILSRIFYRLRRTTKTRAHLCGPPSLCLSLFCFAFL